MVRFDIIMITFENDEFFLIESPGQPAESITSLYLQMKEEHI